MVIIENEEHYYYAMLEIGTYVKLEPDVLKECEKKGSLIVNTAMVEPDNKMIRYYHILCPGKAHSITQDKALEISEDFLSRVYDMSANDFIRVG